MILADKVREISPKSDGWSEQDIGTRGKGIFIPYYRLQNILSRHGDCLWNIMGGAETG